MPLETYNPVFEILCLKKFKTMHNVQNRRHSFYNMSPLKPLNSVQVS